MEIESENIPLLNPINNSNNSNNTKLTKFNIILFIFMLLGLTLIIISAIYVKFTTCTLFDRNSKNPCYGMPESFMILGICSFCCSIAIVFTSFEDN